MAHRGEEGGFCGVRALGLTLACLGRSLLGLLLGDIGGQCEEQTLADHGIGHKRAGNQKGPVNAIAVRYVSARPLAKIRLTASATTRLASGVKYSWAGSVLAPNSARIRGLAAIVRLSRVRSDIAASEVSNSASKRAFRRRM